MTLEEFNSLAKKYLDGNTTEEENRILEEWNKAQNANDLNFGMKQKDEVVKKRMWASISKEVNNDRTTKIRKIGFYVGLAASVILVISSLFNVNIFDKNNFTALLENDNIEILNDTKDQEIVLLSDGTEVHLSKNSSITYDKNFNIDKREVHLRGNAFFKVKRDVTKLFIVHTGNLSTEVLGTSFWINENKKSKSIEVVVNTGKVSVYTSKKSRKNEKNGVILTPNQKVIYDEVTQNIKPSLVEKPKPIGKAEQSKISLIFQSRPLQEVLNVLSKLYGIDFVVSNEQLNQCRITADLNDLDMYIQLELICKSIDAQYEKRGTVIFVNGEGC